MSALNDAMKELRARAEYSRADLARNTGFTNSFINWYEDCAKNPAAATMRAFAEALGVEFRITARGLSIVDPSTDEVFLRDFRGENWR